MNEPGFVYLRSMHRGSRSPGGCNRLRGVSEQDAPPPGFSRTAVGGPFTRSLVTRKPQPFYPRVDDTGVQDHPKFQSLNRITDIPSDIT